jgi:Holliday junction resolvase RusA-like endonuclease
MLIFSKEVDMEKTFVIEGNYYGDKTFPSLNNLLAEFGKNPRAGGRMKKTYQDIACIHARRDLKGYKAQCPIKLLYVLVEPSRGHKRDISNVLSFAMKVIEDALQKIGVIENDDPAHVTGIDYRFEYGTQPRIEVTIIEQGGTDECLK